MAEEDKKQISVLKEGQRVRILIGGPMDQTVEGTVRVVQDVPGKQVGVELDNYAETAHTLDGLLSDSAPLKIDPSGKRSFGKGWFTTDEHVEAL